ncbi:MAG TPA: hypothetical protein VN858_04530 [Casimicrobiaceae bacterium]|jgi:hypothetical protein|nr:hypothetical protein [Casimicrobiaceae bacterium]
MRTSLKALLGALAVVGLAGCASYDYGYGYAYSQPYYGYYGDDYGPYYYDNPYAYGPTYYYGAPSIGFNLGFRDRDRGHYDRYDRYGDHRHYGRSRASVARHGATPRAARVNPASNRANRTARAANVSRHRVPAAPPAQRAQTHRRAAQSTMRAEQ